MQKRIILVPLLLNLTKTIKMSYIHSWNPITQTFYQTLVLPSESIWEEAERLAFKEGHEIWKVEHNSRDFTTFVINHLWQQEQMSK